MKELTIEQKAKAYDEAFRIAQELYNDPNSSNVGKGYVCTVFPEVKESDDENIRKWIITQLELKSDVNNPHDLELMILKSIAWLEKQGEKSDEVRTTGYWNVQDIEHNFTWSEEDKKMFVNIKACLRNANKDYGKELDWLKSLKDKFVPQPKQELSEEDKEFINDLIGIFDGQQYQAHSDEEIVKWLKSIRLPYNKEWDENDEEMLKSIIATCELACEGRGSNPARHLLQMQTDWLKSIKDRVLPQLKQEWSEEDEMNVKKLILYLSCREKIIPEVKSKYIDWLKSLKERIK